MKAIVGSPLGKFAAGVASFFVVVVVLAWAYGHTFGHPDSTVDDMIKLVAGIILGTAGSLTLLNGTVKRTVEQDDELTELRRQVVELHEKVK